MKATPPFLVEPISDVMRPSSQKLASLSDALPFPDVLAIGDVVLSAAPLVSDLFPHLLLRSHALSSQATYQDLVRLFQAQGDAVGVLIMQESTGVPLGMVSRQRVMEWRSHRTTWRSALKQRLPQQPQWWQLAKNYLQLDAQLPLQRAIEGLLAREAETAAEPIVIAASVGLYLCDSQQFLLAYTRFIQAEQIVSAKPAIATLRRQQELILNAIGEGVYGVDLQGHATFVNPAAAQMVGWEPHELIGKSMHPILHHSRPDCSPYPREQCPIYAAFQDGIVHRVAEEVFWRKDGTSFPVEYISTPMRDEQGKLVGAVVAFRDITQRKWAEAVLQRTNEELEQRVSDRTIELQQANEQLKELSELRSRVVTMVCHEFRNPLNNILLSVSSLERYNAQLTDSQKENYLAGIQDNVERMTQMIDAILIIGRVEAKGIEVQPSQFDLISFCRDLVSEILLGNVSDNAQEERIQFKCRSKRLLVTLDPRLLRSILTNVLGNALRYTPAPGCIEFKLSKQKDQVLFCIADQGIGIPPEDVPYLFEPFHRGRNVSNIAGTGLGLNIVKRFVDLQNGQISVVSQHGKGTTFQITLPLRYENPA